MKDRCIVKKQELEKEENTQQIMQDMQEKIKQLEEQINSGDINCNNNNNNTINNITNNDNSTTKHINLVAFGKEDLSYIPDKAIEDMMSHGLDSVILLVREVHYNDNKPEHYNVYISNKRSGDIIIYNGNKWVSKDKKEILERIYNAKGGYLQNKFTILESELSERTIKRFNTFIKKCDNAEIKKEKIKVINNMMYNNREKPMEIKRKMNKEKRKTIK